MILSQLRPAPTASITANTDDAFLTHSEIYKSVGRSSLITTINTKTSIFTKLDLLIEKAELTKTQVCTVLTIFQKIFSMSLYLQRRRWKTSNVQKKFFSVFGLSKHQTFPASFTSPEAVLRQTRGFSAEDACGNARTELHSNPDAYGPDRRDAHTSVACVVWRASVRISCSSTPGYIGKFWVPLLLVRTTVVGRSAPR